MFTFAVMKALKLIFLSWLLLLLAACDGGRRQQMEALLDRADSLNRAYIHMMGGLDSLLSELLACLCISLFHGSAASVFVIS